MRDFFRGWRRKLGAVVLIMAFVSVGFWCRSQTVEDIFVTPIPSVRIESTTGLLRVGIFYHPSINGFSWPGWRSRYLREPPTDPWSTWQFGFLRGKEIRPKSDPRDLLVIFPYWSIIIAMTLVSAYLLLLQPKVRQTKMETNLVSKE